MVACLAAVALTPPVPRHIFRDLVVGARGELLVAHTDGIFQRPAEGKAWRRVLSNTGQLIDAGAAGVYLIDEGVDRMSRIFHSTDQGSNWSQSGTSAGVRGIVAHEGSLYGCAGREVRHSRDGGKVWLRLTVLPEKNGECESLSFGPGMVYMRSGRSASLFAHRLGTNRWVPLNGAPGPSRLPSHVSDLHVDAAGTLYASVLMDRPSDGRDVFDRKVYRSRDHGVTWRIIGMSKQHKAERVLAIREVRIYVECEDRDKGSEAVCLWADRNQNLAFAAASPSVIHAQLRPDLRGRLYQVNMYGVMRWSEALRSWQEIDGKGTPDPYTGEFR